MTLRPTTNFKDSNGVDLGQKLVPKDYLISVYPSIGEQIGIPPELWVWGNGRLTPIPYFSGNNWKQISENSAIKTDGTLWRWGNITLSAGYGSFSETTSQTPITTFAGGTDWKQVSSGTSNSAAIKTDGTLWVWGSFGRLGNYTGFGSATPVTTFVGGNNWKQVSATNSNMAAIKTDGTLWTWGDAYATLGRELPSNILTPITTFAGGNNWADTPTTEPEDLYTLSAGNARSLAIKTDGTLWTWGGTRSFLGVFEDPTLKHTPVTTFTGGTNWKQVSSGGNYANAIKTDGTLWVWGTVYSGSEPGIETITLFSTPVTTFAGGNNWADTPTTEPEDLYTISAGFLHTAAIKTDGTLWTWGNATNGALADRTISLGISKSTPITTFAGGTNWKQISVGNLNTAAIKTDGTLWVWGNNTSVALGINSIGNKSTPVTTFAGGTNWRQVSSGGLHMAAIKTDGTLWTWGRGSYGSLGNLDSSTKSSPVTTFAGGTNWKQVTCGTTHTAAIKTDGTLWTWGNKSILGIIFPNSYNTPVTTFAGGTNWADTPTTEPEDLYTINAGALHTAAIKTDGTLWIWGNATNGRLGNAATTINMSTPITTFAGGTNWKQVSVDISHTAAIKTDGTLWTWGNGVNGRLGNSALTDRNTPVTTFTGGSDWKQVYCGGYHTLAIKTDGTLWGWGITTNGRLGNSIVTGNRSTPITTFAGGTDWKQVSSGTSHTAAIKTDGTLWVWGSGSNGKLGNSVVAGNISTPVTTFAGGTDWKQVSAADTYTAAIKTDGTLWTWGFGLTGRLGNANTTDRSTPVTTFAGGTNWKQVSAGAHTAAIKTDGTLWTWGNGILGALGTNNTTDASTPVTTFAGGTNWKQVSCGTQHTIALKDDGVNKELFVFGNNDSFQLGFDINTSFPFNVLETTTDWRQVNAGGSHTAAIKTDGTLWTWGNGNAGQLGNSGLISRSTPVTTFAGGTDWKQVSSGTSHTAAIKTDGTLWSWGFGTLGQHGNAEIISRSTPVTTFAGGTNWKQVSAGSNYTIALKDDGVNKELFVFGSNTVSQSGAFVIDTRIPSRLSGTNWRQVSSGSNHTAAVKTDGTLWVWGNGGSFFSGPTLGINSISNRSIPVTTFAGGTNWKQVSAGNLNTAAIKTDGTLWVWGNGSNGKLGLNSDVLNKSTPVTTFAGGTDWKQVSVGILNTAAIKTDGTLWVWGQSNFPLGTNDTSNKFTPVTTFAGGTNWKQVSVGESHTAAIKTDGTLWGWGDNNAGNLGTNDTSDKLTPVTTFAGGTNWKQVSCGTQYTIALKDDGVNKELFVFGNNSVSLGNNNTIKKSSLIPSTTFAGGTNWKQVSASNTNVIAIKTDGTLWVWGNNSTGNLGTNDIINRSTPVTTFVGGTNWKQVHNKPAAIKTDGTLWVWGNAYAGSLGVLDSNLNSNRLTPITTFAGGTNWADTSNDLPEELYTISASNAYSEDNFSVLAIKTDGTLWTWGYNYTASLGINSNNVDFANTPVTTFAGGTNWKQVSTCTVCSSAIKTDGTLWVWGNGNFAQLGNNSSGYAYTPVTTFAGGTNWKQVSISYAVGAAIKTDGTLWTWGLNVNGQIGNNTDDIVTSTPVTTFAGGTNWKQVSTGGYVVGAIKTDGTLWTWGANFYGDVGNNDQFSQPHTPVTTFAGGTDWKQVSMSRAGFVGAIKTDGTLWMWGSNRSGQLGNNETSFSGISTPITTFAGGTNWKQVSCGGNLAYPATGFTAAVKTDGTLWTWGYGYYGQLGTNDNSDKLTPVTTFAGGTNWRQVSAGGCFTIAIRGNGISNELYSFGYSKSLAINYIAAVLTPVTTFAGGTNWKQVNSSAAIKTDGTLWTWGPGFNGRLGTNDTSNKSTPVTTFAGGTNWKQVNGTIAIRSVDF